MLTKTQKEEIIGGLRETMDQSKVLVIADYRGLTVKDMDDLKKEVREMGGKMQVAKKTLLNIILKERNIDFDTRTFSGPLVFVFGPEETAIPKKIWTFAKKNDKLKIEGAILENNVLNSEEAIALAKLPSKEELLARVVGTIQAPISGFVHVLSGTVGSFVNVVKAIADKKA